MISLRRWFKCTGRYVSLLLLVALAFCGCSASDSNKNAAVVETGQSDSASVNGVNNAALGGLSVYYDEVVYYVGEGENGGELLRSMAADGENDRVLYTPEGVLDQISGLNTDGTSVYFLETILDPDWLSVAEQRIRKLNIADGTVETIGTAAMVTDCMTLYDGDLYYTEGRDMMEDGPFWMESDFGGYYRLMRLSVDGGKAENLTNFPSKNFLICGDRLWCGPDDWLDGIISFDLDGGDKQEIYTAQEEGVALITVCGGRVYFREHFFEAGFKVYSIDLKGKDRREITEEIGGDCNPLGNTFYFMTYTERSIVSNGDLTVEQGAGEERIEFNASATASDLNIEGADSLTVIPGYADLYCYDLTEKGDFKLRYHEERGEERLGSFSGSWRFYAVAEPNNGRTLYKEHLEE